MKPKLNKDLNNSSDEDDSELNVSSEELIKKRKRRRKGVLQIPPLEEVPEYRKIAERKNA